MSVEPSEYQDFPEDDDTQIDLIPYLIQGIQDLEDQYNAHINLRGTLLDDIDDNPDDHYLRLSFKLNDEVIQYLAELIGIKRKQLVESI